MATGAAAPGAREGDGMGNAIAVEGLAKRFGNREALRGIDFEIERGSVFGVIGPNGAGKTTAMRCLLDIIRPTAGTVRVLGTDPRRAGPEVRRRIGYLPGELALERRITGRRMMSHFAAISGPVRPGRVDGLAARLGLELDRQSRKLSKGNKQKLGLVQAFMHDPELLILDEPTSGLDPLMQREFLAMVEEAKGRGQTVFLSSHMIGEIQQAADTVAILRDGLIVRTATVAELRAGARRRLRVVAAAGPDALAAHLDRLPGLERSGVVRLEEGASVLDAAYAGDVGALLHALSGLDVRDLVLEEPDLEEAVLELYGSGPGNGRLRAEGERR